MNNLIQIENGTALLNPTVSHAIAVYEKQMKELKAQEDDLKKSILAEMEKHNLIKLETDELTISYIASSDRETFDTKKFREDCPTTYDAYVKMSPVKASVRIKLK